ncbi:MAG: phosphotransferase, partial [Bacteroidales bacterium]|nr:phosphotransferase [Bacteroidales bacterium]
MGADYLSIRIREEQAAQIARSLYGLEGEVVSLPGDRDFNFRISSRSGVFILKVSRPEQEVEYIQFQHELLQFVANSNINVEAPETIHDIHGKYISDTKDESGHKRMVRLLSWVEGRVWSTVNPITDALLFSLGEQAGKLTSALQDFEHPGAVRKLEWDLAQAGWTTQHVHLLSEEQNEIVSCFLDQFSAAQIEYQQLRKSIVHNDANDTNVIVTRDPVNPEVKAVIDFGDAIHTQTINDLAITIAYAVMGKPDVLSAALPIVKGYHNQFPVLEKELEFLYNLVAMRLVISVTKSAINKKTEPDNEYLMISEKPAWEVLEKWIQLKEEHALFSFRHACNYTPHPEELKFKEWAKSNPSGLSTLFPTLGREKIRHLDLSVSSTWLGHQSEFENLDLFQYKLGRLQATVPKSIIAGGYLEPRTTYTTSAYDKTGNNGTESRTVHLGIDLWIPAGTPVHALFDGMVATAVNDSGNKEYGGLIILKHKEDQLGFYTLHGHLSPASLENIEVGQSLKK